MTNETLPEIGDHVLYYPGVRFDVGMVADRVMAALVSRVNEDCTVNVMAINGLGEAKAYQGVPFTSGPNASNYPYCWWPT